ncbi:MAG TPA: hypothetical protein VN924_31295 [Bryobacteraceae bacterium]|nr:hypothetical protein [Bryobacteraceae bacterium]
MEEPTLASFAYVRLPLAVSAVAFLAGALGTLRAAGRRASLAAAFTMMLFFHAARLAMVVFRSVSVVAAAGRAAAARSRRQSDCGPSLLHILLRILLHESNGAAAEWGFNKMTTDPTRRARRTCSSTKNPKIAGALRFAPCRPGRLRDRSTAVP